MGSVAVVIGGMVFGRIGGALASIVISIVAALAYAGGRALGRPIGALSAALVAGALALVWTAAAFQIAQRLVDSDFGVRWVVWFTAVLLSLVPIGLALQSAERHAQGGVVTDDQAAMKRALERGAVIQLVGGAAMLFSDRVWDWWRWLPFG
jgi:hypothetical protein